MPTTSPKTGAILVPADGGARAILDEKRLLQVVRAQAREPCRLPAKREEKVRHVITFLQAAAVEIVAPPEGNRPPFSNEALELEFLELEALHMRDQLRLFGHGNEGRLVFEPGGKDRSFRLSLEEIVLGDWHRRINPTTR